MSIDDDDFDLGDPKAAVRELSALLDEVKHVSGAAAPDAISPAPATANVPASLAPGAAQPADTASRGLAPAVPGYEVYGLPGSMPWEWLAYAFRVHRGSTSARERAVLLGRDLVESVRVLDEAHATLGRSIQDAADLHGIPLPAEAVAEVRTALSSMESLASTRGDIQKKAKRDNAMASARRESAAASLDPVSAEQERSLAELDAAEKAVESAKGALAVADGRYAEAATSGADEIRAADVAIDAGRAALRAAEARHRDAALAYAEVRRRAILQMSRVAEAENAVEGARVEERRQTRELRRQQDLALKALREAYAKLGSLVYDHTIGQEYASGAFASVRRAREARGSAAAQVQGLRVRAGTYDEEAFRKGKLVAYGIVGAVVLLMVIVAIAS